MIQRIQSIYLLLIILLLGILLLTPLGEITVGQNTFDFSAFGWFSGEDSMTVSFLPIGIFLLLLMGYNFVILLLFKNRMLQVKLAKLNGILLTILIVVILMSADQVATKLTAAEEEAVIDYGIGAYASFLPLIFNYLAIKAIKKDEELVRSADRLR